MRVALARRGYSGSGGAEAYLIRFARALSEAGHVCQLYTDAEWPAGEWPFEIRRISSGRSPARFSSALLAAQPEREADCLFSLERVARCDLFRAGDGVHAAWLRRRAVFEAPHRAWFRAFSSKHRDLLRLERSMFAEQGTRAVIANSQLVKREIVEEFSYPAERIHVVYNGVPAAPPAEKCAAWRLETRRELNLPDDACLFLFAGTGWERKGLKQAILALSRSEAKNAWLCVAGRGKPGEMPRHDRVRYIGATNELPRWMAAADAFILPTFYDPFSNASLEAVSMGLPLITTAANGCAEILEGDEGEVLADPLDIDAFSRAIFRWSADPALRAAARPRLQEKGARFSVEANLRQTLSVLSALPTR